MFGRCLRSLSFCFPWEWGKDRFSRAPFFQYALGRAWGPAPWVPSCWMRMGSRVLVYLPFLCDKRGEQTDPITHVWAFFSLTVVGPKSTSSVLQSAPIPTEETTPETNRILRDILMVSYTEEIQNTFGNFAERENRKKREMETKSHGTDEMDPHRSSGSELGLSGRSSMCLFWAMIVGMEKSLLSQKKIEFKKKKKKCSFSSLEKNGDKKAHP